MSSTGPRGGSYKQDRWMEDEVERLPPHLMGASGPNEMQERRLWRLYRGPRGPNEDPTRLRDRDWRSGPWGVYMASSSLRAL